MCAWCLSWLCAWAACRTAGRAMVPKLEEGGGWVSACRHRERGWFPRPQADLGLQVPLSLAGAQEAWLR